MEQQQPIHNKEKEENAIVLDFLSNGYPFDSRPSHLKTPIVQAIGKKRFTLLEFCPKKGISLQPSEEVYIGEGKRTGLCRILQQSSASHNKDAPARTIARPRKEAHDCNT